MFSRETILNCDPSRGGTILECLGVVRSDAFGYLQAEFVSAGIAADAG